MPDITIPDAAVEAAARAYFHSYYDRGSSSIQAHRAALTAAAPYIAAQERARIVAIASGPFDGTEGLDSFTLAWLIARADCDCTDFEEDPNDG